MLFSELGEFLSKLDLDKREAQLKGLIQEYHKYAGPSGFIGGIYYGSTAMQSYSFGGIKTIRCERIYHAYNSSYMVLGIRIGSAFCPYESYSDKIEIRNEILAKVSPMLKELIAKSSEFFPHIQKFDSRDYGVIITDLLR